MKNHSRVWHRRTRRRGGAFLLLVVALVLVVLGATQAVLRGEVAAQRNRQRQLQSDTLERAIDAAQNLRRDVNSTFEFPIDDAQHVTISLNDDQTQWTARWMRGQTIQTTLIRKISPLNQPSRPADPEI